MSEQKFRNYRISTKLNVDKLSSKLKKITLGTLGHKVSNFLYHILNERTKSESLSWCFANIKRLKIFLVIFHANQSNTEIYKEEIAKKLTEYSYKTIAKIVDDGISKGIYVLLPPEGITGKDAKVKNIRPAETLMVDFLNWSIEIINYIKKDKSLH